MKKLLGIIVLILFPSANAFADKGYLENFNDFLSDNTKFISQNNIGELKIVNTCKDEKRYIVEKGGSKR